MRSEQEVNRAVEQYSDMILRLCMVSLKHPQDAEDILQTVFLKYALSDKDFESEEHEKAWLIRVATNACKDSLKAMLRRSAVPLEEAAGCFSEMREEQSVVLQAVRELPKEYREVIYLHFYEGYTAGEIAGILRKNPSTVYTHLRRGKELLKQRLGGAADEE